MNKTKTQTNPKVDREAVRVLAIELGARETARRLGIKESTVLSWARRYGWNLPKRKGGGSGKNALSLAIKPGDALIAVHEDMENATKTGLAQIIAKAVLRAAKGQALDVNNPAQLQALCLSAARLYGWKSESEVNVAVNNKVGVVITDAKRAELQAKLRELQDAHDSEKQEPAVVSLPAPETLPQANVGAENAPSGPPLAAQSSPSPAMKALGYDLALPESPQPPQQAHFTRERDLTQLRALMARQAFEPDDLKIFF